MKKIIISPYARKLPNGKINAKQWPFFPELVKLLQKDGYEIIQLAENMDEPNIGADGYFCNQPLAEIEVLLLQCDFFISIDSFLPHLANTIGRSGVVLWGQSDPNIFGYVHNLNILKDRQYLRPDQFGLWTQCEFKPEAFMPAQEVYEMLKLRF